MRNTTLPIRIVSRRETVATTAAIARSALSQRKAERAVRAATLMRQAASRDTGR